MTQQEYINKMAESLQRFLISHNLKATVGCSGESLYIYNPEQVLFYFPTSWGGIPVRTKQIDRIIPVRKTIAEESRASEESPGTIEQGTG